MKYIYSPYSYFLLLKADWHQEHNLFNQEDFPERITLGGIYNSVKEDENFIYTEKNGKILKNRVVPFEDGKYSYKLGDNVVFSPICTELEIKSLTYNNNLIVGKVYKIIRIINHYYVQLLNEHNEISNPIRFCDIKLVK